MTIHSTYIALHDIHTYILVQEMNRVQQSIFDTILIETLGGNLMYQLLWLANGGLPL